MLYEIRDNKYYKEGKHVTKKSVIKELKKYQLDKLLLNGKFKVRESSTSDSSPKEKIKKTSKLKNKSTTKVKEKKEKSKTSTLKSPKKSKIPNIEEIQHQSEVKRGREVKVPKKIQKYIKSERPNYVPQRVYYSHKQRWDYELWKKNIKYGYYNFICKLEDLEEETINQAILEDYERQQEESKRIIETPF